MSPATCSGAEPAGRLPLTRQLSLLYASSLVLALLVAIAALIGLIRPDTIYPTASFKEAFVANDLVNLLLGLPVLLLSLWLTRRGQLLGLLLWPGALFYLFYNAVAYLLALPLNVAFVINLLVTGGTIYTLAALLISVDGHHLAELVGDLVPHRPVGGVLLGLGLLFLLLVLVKLGGALLGTAPLNAVDLAVSSADVLTIPAWLIGGWLLWRRRPFGYLAGPGLLFQASMLFAGLIVFLLVQPWLSSVSLALTDLLVTLGLSLICFVPFFVLVRRLSRLAAGAGVHVPT